MQAINCIRMGILLLFCAYVSYTDIKNGQIQNKASFIAIVSGIVLASISYFIGDRAFILSYIVNVLILITFSIVLYLTHAWAGGDVKMLGSIAVLYPPQMYWDYNGNNHTLGIIIIIAFCVGFIYIVIESLINLRREGFLINQRKYWLFQSLKGFLINYLYALLFVYGFSQIYISIISKYYIFSSIGYLIVSLCVIYVSAKIPIFREKIVVYAILVFDIVMTLFTRYIPLSREWKNYLFVLLFMIIRIFAEQYNYQVIEVAQLKPGMVLSRASSILLQVSRVKGLPGISDETLKSRLTPSEIDSIHRWEKTKAGREKLTIVRKIPFAIFISIGVIVYIVIGKLFKWY